MLKANENNLEDPTPLTSRTQSRRRMFQNSDDDDNKAVEEKSKRRGKSTQRTKSSTMKSKRNAYDKFTFDERSDQVESMY